MATDEKAEIYARQMSVKGKSEEMSEWLADFVTIPDGEFVKQPSFFQRIKAPVTLIWADRDALTPLWPGEKLRGLLPGAELVVLKGIGHIPQIEDPEAYKREFRAFLLALIPHN